MQLAQSSLQSANSLGTPSLFSRHRPLANLHILIVDADHQLSALVRNILTGLGCRQVSLARDGAEALALLNESPADIIIAESNLKSIGGIALARKLRDAKEPALRRIPVLLMSANSDVGHVKQARDAGVDEYMLKPFCAKSLLAHIYGLIEKPRGFVISRHYIGPDRRRTPQNDNQPAGKRADGAPFVARHPPLMVGQQDLYNQVVSGAPRMLPPDYALKKKIGFAVTEDTKMSVPVISAPLEGIALLRQEVQELRDAYAMLQKNDSSPQLFLHHLQKAALSVARNARYSGHDRVAQIAVLMVDFQRHYFRAGRPQHIKILYTYIDALSTLVTHDIKGDAGSIGEALYQNLRDLTQYYAVA